MVNLSQKEINMKIIAFNGSPHNNGVIQRGISVLCGELNKEGVETEIIQVGGAQIRGCIDCRKCGELKKCVFNDDLVNPSAEKVNAADGIIIGSPVYYGSIAGTFKSFLDRLFFSGLNLEYKAAYALVSCRRSGGINAFHQMNNYLNLAKAVIVPTVYWGVIHGNNETEALEDKEGLHIMETAGRNMAWLVKTLALGKKEIPLPQKTPRVRTNFIR
jgi:multimeric flavodoxin WrbA